MDGGCSAMVKAVKMQCRDGGCVVRVVAGACPACLPGCAPGVFPLAQSCPRDSNDAF